MTQNEEDIDANENHANEDQRMVRDSVRAYVQERIATQGRTVGQESSFQPPN